MTEKAKVEKRVPWPAVAVLVAVIFFGYLIIINTAYHESVSNIDLKQNFDDMKEQEDPEFVIEDESPNSENYSYSEIDYPTARYANGTILYAAIGFEDCLPRIDTVEQIRGSTIVITPKSYPEKECQGEIVAVIERVSHDDGSMIEREVAQTVVINSNIPEELIWTREDTTRIEEHEHNHEH